MYEDLSTRFTQCRAHSLALASPLSEADMQIQADAFASPSKWHLAHTSWFFDEFILKPFGQQTAQLKDFSFLFNSYYESVGRRQAQGTRGLMSRPSLTDILEYRALVDHALLALLTTQLSNEVLALIALGINHEQQHQELFLTDILYNLSHNPLYPAYHHIADPITTPDITQSSMLAFEGGLVNIGHASAQFHYDNEAPQHRVFLAPFSLANTLVTNAEWIAFIEDGGYENPLLWLSDGWHTKHKEHWQMPLYWERADATDNQSNYMTFSLSGLKSLDLNAPVRHISYFEADAYANWVGKRLPTEGEWEHAVTQTPNLVQAFDQLWQWTASPYTAYPGFKASKGAVGEYNGKFMNGQYVLRGSSFATAQNHSRTTYRNFFYPHQRWQFSGLRLAQ